MKGHWASQTRKLNRHFQSNITEKQKLILWELNGLGLGSANYYRICPYVMSVSGTQLITLSPRRYKLCWEFHSTDINSNEYTEEAKPGIVYAFATSKYWSNYYDDNGNVILVNETGGHRIIGNGYYGQVQNLLTDIQSNIIQSSKDTQLSLTRDMWYVSNYPYHRWNAYMYNPDHTDGLNQFLGRDVTFTSGIMGTVHTAASFSDSNTQLQECLDNNINRKYGEIFLDFTGLQASERVYSRPMIKEGIDPDGNPWTGQGTTVIYDPDIEVCVYFPNRVRINGTMTNIYTSGKIWLE